jgi:tetratricopeptide (TPR) repeat protein
MLLSLAAVANAQELPVSTDRFSADPNSAVIEGRVSLPSGTAVDRNVRITLRNSKSVLYVLYSNKHGEFRFHDLSEGIYFVDAEIQGDAYLPATERIVLGRGIVYPVRLQLRENKELQRRSPSGNVISATELSQAVPAAARKEYDRGLKHVEKGDFQLAATRFRQAVDLYPDYIAARNDLGAQYLKLKRIDEAEALFLAVLADDPGNFNAKMNLGLVRIERREFAAALPLLVEALRLDSSHGPVRMWLGLALFETGSVAEGERELSKSLILGGSECVEAHYHLARVYLGRGDRSSALASVRAYLQESPRGEYAKEAIKLAETLRDSGKRAPSRRSP